MATVEIHPINRDRAGLKQFLRVATDLYRNDPHWVAPLESDARKVLGPANPFFQHAEAALWIARRSGRVVGRIAAILNDAHNRTHASQTVHFGFFECIDDQAVANTLFQVAAEWAAQRGGRELVGPMNPSINEECGLLVDGFASRPLIMMTYNPPYYARLVETAGFVKAKDLIAFQIPVVASLSRRLAVLTARFRQRHPDIQIRAVRRSELHEVIQRVKEVYNDAWEANWGHVPMTSGEIDFLAARLKPLIIDGLALIAGTKQEAAGFLLMLPDFNEPAQALRGRLLTPALAGFLPYLLGWKTPRDARLVAFGVKKKFRNHGIEPAMLGAALETALKLGFQNAEASWVLEDNLAVAQLIQTFGGRAYKTYRIYERAI